MAYGEKKDRNERIKKDRKNGMTYASIAKIHNISTERARQICLKKEYCGELKELSLRVRYALNRAGIMTKEQLLQKLNEEGQLYVHNVGAKGIAEIEAFTGKKLMKGIYNILIRVVQDGEQDGL